MPSSMRAVKGASMALVPGELTLLMGPSGSGKTTLLSILGCILSPTSGTLRIAGVDTSNLDAEQLADLRRKHMGFIFQSYNLFPTLTALENVRIALDVRGQKGFAAANRADAGLLGDLHGQVAEIASIGRGHKRANEKRQGQQGEGEGPRDCGAHSCILTRSHPPRG